MGVTLHGFHGNSRPIIKNVYIRGRIGESFIQYLIATIRYGGKEQSCSAPQTNALKSIADSRF